MQGSHSIRILLLEDDLATVVALVYALQSMEEELLAQGKDISLVVLSEYTMVEQYINPDTTHSFDIILLDRDCKVGGSFHALDIERFGVEKVIAISSTPQWNEEAQARGVKRVVWKDYDNLYGFAHKVVREVRSILGMPPRAMSSKDDEPLFEDAVSIMKQTGKASAALLQRRLRIGYARAARLLDMMEDEGIVSSGEGNEPRKILE